MTIMDRQKRALPTDQGSQRMRVAIMHSLQYQDNSVTLAVFLMLVNPSAYKPKVGQEFKFWEWPKTHYEMDHCGSFIETNEDQYVYSGGETKWSYSRTYPHKLLLITTETREARAQLEERIQILDGVMNLGYRKRCTFALRVFVPTLGPSVSESKFKRSIDVMRRKYLRNYDGKSVQTDGDVAATAMLVDGGNEPGVGKEEQDVGAGVGVEVGADAADIGAAGVTALQLEKIEYLLKIESMET